MAAPSNLLLTAWVHGAIVSSIAIGLTVKILDTPSHEMVQQGIMHAIGTDKYSGATGTLWLH